MTTPSGMPPQAQMMQLVNGTLISRALGVVAELGIADHVADGPRLTAELAEATRSNRDALFRARAVAGLNHSVRTGEPSLGRDQPNTDVFEILAADPVAQATCAGRRLERIIPTRSAINLVEAVPV